MPKEVSQVAADTKKGKGRITVALSERSEQLLEDLMAFSGAETMTEVIRDSLRLSYLIMVAQKEGKRIELCDPRNPKDRRILTGYDQVIPA
jgi:hypothetical protein